MPVELKSQIEKLGLKPNQASVYLALLETGESPVGKIINKTQLHREQVYTALRQLEQEGFVRSFNKKRKRHYVAENPKIILRKIQEKKNLASEILPNLLQLFRATPQIIRIFEGPEGFEEVQKDINATLKRDDEYYVIGASGKSWYEITKPFLQKYRKVRYRRKIREKMVTYKSELPKFWKYEEKDNPYIEIRAVPDEFSVPSSTKVYDNKIVIQILSDEPLAIMIQNKEVAQAYKQYFQALWRRAM